MDQVGAAAAATNPLLGTFKGLSLDLQSDKLCDLDSVIPDVLGLRAIQPRAAVVNPPFVALCDLGCLRLDWPRALFTFKGRYQFELDQMRKECKERFGSTQSGSCTLCTLSRIWADMLSATTWIWHSCGGAR